MKVIRRTPSAEESPASPTDAEDRFRRMIEAALPAARRHAEEVARERDALAEIRQHLEAGNEVRALALMRELLAIPHLRAA